MPEPASVYAWYVIACLIANPTTCREIKISVPYATEINCNYTWLPLSVEWLKENEPEFEKLALRGVDCRDRIKHPRKTAVAEPKE